MGFVTPNRSSQPLWCHRIARTMAKFPHWKVEVSTVHFRQSVVAEFVAMFMFIFSTIGCVVFTQDGGISTARQMEVSLIFGNAITILVFIFAGISGANINPAVSLSLFVSKKISLVKLGCYTAAQCLGAMCGAGMVRIMTPALFDAVDGGANQINPSANAKEALGVEFGCTFMLVMVVMAATDSKRAEVHKHLSVIAPMIVGLAVTAAHFIAVPVDNCSINPARTFGVAAISGNWSDHWVFWFGPCLGAIAASLVYQYLFEYVPTDEALAVEEEEEVKKDGEMSLAEAVGLGSPAFSSKTPVKAAASPLPVEAVSNEPSGLWAK